MFSDECDLLSLALYGTQCASVDIRDLIVLLRTILYPRLEDHDIVCHYPPVQGVEKNVFFFSHSNKENAEADSVSKHNTFEVCQYLDPIVTS
jgi:hypothetical protein